MSKMHKRKLIVYGNNSNNDVIFNAAVIPLKLAKKEMMRCPSTKLSFHHPYLHHHHGLHLLMSYAAVTSTAERQQRSRGGSINTCRQRHQRFHLLLPRSGYIQTQCFSAACNSLPSESRGLDHLKKSQVLADVTC